MIRSLPSRIALLAFSVAVVAGLRAANSAATVLWRAILALFVAYAIGELAMWASKLVLSDSLRRRKWEIDKNHVGAVSRVGADGAATLDAAEAG